MEPCKRQLSFGSKPDPFAGDVTKAVADAGLFRLRAVLIGSVAFQHLSRDARRPAALGVMQTGDAAFAISASIQDNLPPTLEILQSVDPEFRAVPHQADKAKVVAFQNAKSYRVEFLTGNRGSDEYRGKPSPMPALGGASAENLRFLDYLIYEPIRTVLLFREGVNRAGVEMRPPNRWSITWSLYRANWRFIHQDELTDEERASGPLQVAVTASLLSAPHYI
ncbi:GSU2403 family nucleotidyltransferase fold protein [Neorhizobium alkalisoli]|uniref:GSU2403 family nucleotidyltransferase fold protein n=1 Tax=Neorhizobium alkalisoli TaxID=528178 RepID=UPI000CF9734F|nr:GSU2403 family nucleotidyltransferase fold protein [Neorhizobium alkalisoli]